MRTICVEADKAAALGANTWRSRFSGEDRAASNRTPGKQVTSNQRVCWCCALVYFLLPFPETFGIIYGCCLVTICLKEHF